MNRKELEHVIAQRLRSDGVKKHISFKPDDIYIRLGDGKETKYSLSPIDRGFIYTQADIKNILDVFFEIIGELIGRGENVALSGFGTFFLRKHKGIMASNFGRGECEVPDRWKVKFSCGEILKRAEKVYNLLQEEEELGNTASDTYIGGV